MTNFLHPREQNSRESLILVQVDAALILQLAQRNDTTEPTGNIQRRALKISLRSYNYSTSESLNVSTNKL